MLWRLLGRVSQSHSLGSPPTTVSRCPTATLERGTWTCMTPPQCCRVRLLCNTSMSHPSYSWLFSWSWAELLGLFPLGRGSADPTARAQSPALVGEILALALAGSEQGQCCCLLMGFCSVPLPSVPIFPCILCSPSLVP